MFVFKNKSIIDRHFCRKIMKIAADFEKNGGLTPLRALRSPVMLLFEDWSEIGESYLLLSEFKARKYIIHINPSAFEKYSTNQRKLWNTIFLVLRHEVSHLMHFLVLRRRGCLNELEYAAGECKEFEKLLNLDEKQLIEELNDIQKVIDSCKGFAIYLKNRFMMDITAEVATTIRSKPTVTHVRNIGAREIDRQDLFETTRASLLNEAVSITWSFPDLVRKEIFKPMNQISLMITTAMSGLGMIEFYLESCERNLSSIEFFSGHILSTLKSAIQEEEKLQNIEQEMKDNFKNIFYNMMKVLKEETWDISTLTHNIGIKISHYLLLARPDLRSEDLMLSPKELLKLDNKHGGLMEGIVNTFEKPILDMQEELRAELLKYRGMLVRIESLKKQLRIFAKKLVDKKEEFRTELAPLLR